MAEDKVNILETPKGCAFDIGQVRRFSTDSVRSRYLLPTLSSCHDLCKGGIKHLTEADVRSPRFRKASPRGECQRLVTVPETDGASVRKGTPRAGQQGLETVPEAYIEADIGQEAETLPGRNMRNALGLQPCIDSDCQTLDDPNVENAALEESGVSQKLPDPSKLKNLQSKGASLTPSASMKSPRSAELRRPSGIGARSMKAGIRDSRRMSEAGIGNRLRSSGTRARSLLSRDSIRTSEIERQTELGTSEIGEERVLEPISMAATPKSAVKNSSMTDPDYKESDSTEPGKTKDLKPISAASNPKRTANKSSIKNAEGSGNPSGNSNEKSHMVSRKAKPEETSSEDVPEKTLYIIESSVNNKSEEVAELSPTFPPSTVEKISKPARKDASSEDRSPPSVEKKNLRHIKTGARATKLVPSLDSPMERKSLRRTTNGSRALPGHLVQSSNSPTERKILRRTQYGSPFARSSPTSFSSRRSDRSRVSSRMNQTETNSPKVHLKKTPTSRLNPSSPLSSLRKGLRRTQHEASPLTPTSVKRKTLRHVPDRTPVGRSTPASVLAVSSQKSGRSREPSVLDETETDSKTLDMKSENKIRVRKSGVTVSSPKDKDAVAQKLKFRRGRVIELPSEVITPRRLKFRRRVIVDNAMDKVDPGRRSFGKKEFEDNEREVRVDGNQGNLSQVSKNVLLKHQDLAHKKFAETLFNNVIEETANKLVETRRSKVKALVGAFETVISLQEKQPPRKVTLY